MQLRGDYLMTVSVVSSSKFIFCCYCVNNIFHFKVQTFDYILIAVNFSCNFNLVWKESSYF